MFNSLKQRIIIKLKGKNYYYASLGVKVGKNCTFMNGVDFGSEPYLITLGDNVRISGDVSFVNHDGGMHVIRTYYNKPQADKFGKIIVGNNVFIGNRSIIMPGVAIGNNVIIGAGSIVTKNIDDNSIACGVPAKIISTLDDYFKKNSEKILNTKGMDRISKKKYLEDYFNEKKY